MLFCFDVDGTLLCDEMKGMGQYVEGIIRTDYLDILHGAGHHIAICSPSPYYPHKYQVFAKFGSNEYRWKNVADAMDCYQISKDSTVYIDDLEANLKQLKEYGVHTLTPEEFLRTFA